MKILSDTLRHAKNIVTQAAPEQSIISLLDNKFILGLIAGFLAVLFTQGVVALIGWYKTRNDLNNKKKIILLDLVDKKKELGKFSDACLELIVKFKRREIRTHDYDAFTGLHVEIYNAIPKTDMYKIFGDDFLKIVDVYTSIGFIKRYDINYIYSDFIQKFDQHKRETKDIPEHEEFCGAVLGWIELVQGNLNKRMQTTKQVVGLIDKVLKV